MLSLALNFVKEKDKNCILVHIFKHSKLSQKAQQKHARKFVVNTNLRLRYKIFLFLSLANKLHHLLHTIATHLGVPFYKVALGSFLKT